MIIESIHFFNAGVFRGHQSIQLAPTHPERTPVVLVGGKNGRGKTTLLDSIHFVLYGKLARLAKRGDQTWDDFLRGFIHRQAPSTEGAAVTLVLRLHTEGIEHRLKVQREWKVTGSRVKETLSVWRDGVINSELAEDWTEFVEGLMPAQIAHLFLFDGEQIAALADPEQSREILKTGVYGLLGADLVGRLEKDLQSLARRIRISAAPDDESKKVESLEKDFVASKRGVERLKLDAIEKHRERQGIQNRIDELQKEILAQGGHLLDQRNVLVQEEQQRIEQINEFESELRRMQGGSLPLVGVLDLLKDIEQQADREQSHRGGRELLRKLEKRDRQMLKDLAKTKLQKGALDTTALWLKKNRHDYALEINQVKELFGFSADGYALLKHMVNKGLQGEVVRQQEIQSKLRLAKEALEPVQRRLGRIPDPEAIRHLLEEQTERQKSLAILDGATEAIRQAKQAADSELLQADRKLQKAMASLNSRKLEQAEVVRKITHIERAKETVYAFKNALVMRDINRIEHEVLLCVQRLFSKQKLITRISIDPQTFQLSIYDSGGIPFSPHQLSAGERQLLAISILWGLSKASGKQLPVFIDTPLGRLDHDHRDKLVSTYFPNAGHQVVLLSTEEEITPSRFERLAPWVGRVASLVYDESTQSSRIEEGHFFDEIKEIGRNSLLSKASS